MAGPAALSTREDLRALDDRTADRFAGIDARFDGMDTRFELLTAEMRAGFAAVDHRLEVFGATLRTEFHKELTAQTRTMMFGLITTFVAFAALMLTVYGQVLVP